MYELIIIGGGPAGSAAAVYSARKQLKSAIIGCDLCRQQTDNQSLYFLLKL